jgi:hypothetical protein
MLLFFCFDHNPYYATSLDNKTLEEIFKVYLEIFITQKHIFITQIENMI